jgi:hypothetical protein
VEVGSESATVSDVQDVLYTYRYRRQNPACGWIERDIYIQPLIDHITQVERQVRTA